MKLFKIAYGSVATRTIVLVLLVVTTLMLAANIGQTLFVREYVGDEMRNQASRSMDGALKIIDNRISNVETAVNTAASYADLFATDAQKSYVLLERLIEDNEDIAAVTLMYRADFFESYGRYFAPTIARNPLTNELEPDEIGGPESEFCYLETDSNWVYTNLLDEGYWCLPYMDSISTKRPMVSYSVPLHDENGEIYAVLCADVGLDWVQKIVDEAKPYDYSRVLVLSRDSQYVCHPDPEWIQSVNAVKQAQQSNDTSYIALIHRMLSGQRRTDTLMKDYIFNPSQASGKNEGRTYVFYAPVPRVLWSVSFSVPEDKIMEGPNRMSLQMIFAMLAMLILIAITLNVIIRHQLKPIQELASLTRDISKGNFNLKLPTIETKDEIRHLRDSFEEMQSSLATYVEELQESTTAKATMENELLVASNIQTSMLPKKFPPYPERNDIDIFGSLVPAKAVGGDLYDFYIRDEKLFFCIGDVSGKGVPASLYMAVTRSLFRNVSAHVAEPELIVSALNNAQSEGNDSNMFVTIFIGVLELSTGLLRYCNAGHDSPLLIGRSVGTLPCDSNLPIGIISGYEFKQQEVLIDPMTTIFLFTDGLTEAENSSHAQFGDSRISRLANDLLGLRQHQPDPRIAKMTEAVHQFVGNAEQSDDLTMLAIQFKGTAL